MLFPCKTPKSYFQNENNIRIMPKKKKKKKKKKKRLNITLSTRVYVRVYECRKEEKCDENGDANRAAFPKARHFKSGDVFIRTNKRKSLAKSFRRDVNENCSLGIDCSYHRCAYGRLSVTIQRQLNYAIHVRGDNSKIHPGSLLTPIDWQSFNFCRKWIARSRWKARASDVPVVIAPKRQ